MKPQDQVERFDLFATTITRFRPTNLFDDIELASMINDIEMMIKDNRNISNDELVPKTQSSPILFDQEQMPNPVWQKLASSFANACYFYKENVPDFCKHTKTLQLSKLRAWFYKSDNKVNHTRISPCHNHSPAFLSGVFYLQIPPGFDETSGTYFRDPRGAGSDIYREMHVTAVPLTWTIFPGWMYHRAGQCDTDQPRYTIAADCYVML